MDCEFYYPIVYAGEKLLIRKTLDGKVEIYDEKGE